MTILSELIGESSFPKTDNASIIHTPNQKLGILLHKRICSVIYTLSSYYRVNTDSNGIVISCIIKENKIVVIVKFLRNRKRIIFTVEDKKIDITLRIKSRDVVKDFLDLYIPIKSYSGTFKEIKKKLLQYIYWGITPQSIFTPDIKATAIHIGKFIEDPLPDVLYYGTVIDVVVGKDTKVNKDGFILGDVTFLENDKEKYRMEVPADYKKYIIKGCIGIFDSIGRYKFYTFRGAKSILNFEPSEYKRIHRHIKEQLNTYEDTNKNY